MERGDDMTVAKNLRIVIGTMALASIAALGGAAIADAAPGESSADLDKLMGLLPAGFTTSNCQPVNPPTKYALATVDCGQNSLPNGPAMARFSLVSDQITLDGKFQSSVNADVVTPCPRDYPSPGTWRYRNTDVVAGQVACGTYQGTPDLAWTDNAKLVLGDIEGDNIEALFDYWWTYG
jgi:serine/threonine kinase PknH